MSDDLEELVARVEAATGPDRELDVAIVYGLYPNIGNYEGQCIGDEPIFWHEPYRKQPCPDFTASLDAAMTLVPENAVWGVSMQETGPATGYYFQASVMPFGPIAPSEAKAATPALALTAAALRAHQERKEGE